VEIKLGLGSGGVSGATERIVEADRSSG
jgi:hypothetical protein